MTKEEYAALAGAAKVTPAQVDEYNETLRVWRAVCQVCKLPLIGTLAEIRKHRHDGPEAQ
jgi:hypothetical protein